MISSWFFGPIIDGLEYEDAYVHLAAAKFQFAHPIEATDNFYVFACAAGSTDDCAITVTYGTQMIGYSVLLNLIHHIVLKWGDLSNIVSYVSSIMTIQILWSLLRRYSDIFSSFLSICLLITAPSFYIISGSSFAEPLYTFLLTCFLSISLKIMEDSICNIKVLDYISLLICGLLMISVKKEGLLIVVMTIIWSLWIYKRSLIQTLSVYSLGVILTIGVFQIGISIFVFRIFDAGIRHSADIGTAAFDLTFIPKLLPVLIEAGSRPSFYGVLWIVGVVLVPVALFMRERTPLFILVIIGGFIGLYSAHARHAAFVHGAHVNAEEMVRYLYTISPLVSLFCGTVLTRIKLLAGSYESVLTSVKGSALAGIIVVAGLTLCLMEVSRQRVDFASDEVRGRLAILAAIGITKAEKPVIISPFSLALVARGPTDLQVIDKSIVQSRAAQKYLADQTSLGRRILDFQEQ